MGLSEALAKATASRNAQNEKRAAERQALRSAAPICAAFIDALRAEFGADVQVTYLCEAGIERGKKS